VPVGLGRGIAREHKQRVVAGEPIDRLRKRLVVAFLNKATGAGK
jgi:hypothetical protein